MPIRKECFTHSEWQTQEFFFVGPLCRKKLLGGPRIEKMYVIFKIYSGFIGNLGEAYVKI